MAWLEWRRKVLPEYRLRAQEAVAQLRAVGIRAELRRDDWLVFDLHDVEVDHRAVEKLDRVWPHWRDCVSD
jgi:hypothetical protein